MLENLISRLGHAELIGERTIRLSERELVAIINSLVAVQRYSGKSEETPEVEDTLTRIISYWK